MTADIHNADPAEVRKFDTLASRWWDPEGDFKPLHHLNPVRLQYINDRAGLDGKRVLDVGCGGGLLSEAMAGCGADVTGIDMAEAALAVANLHLQVSGIETVRYLLSTAENLADSEAESFDVVVCMEVLEHVPDPARLVSACRQLARPGGKVFFSTLNRNPKAYVMAILGAEYLLSLLPRGTHEYERFIKPSELRRWGTNCGMRCVDLTGLSYAPISGRAGLTDNTDVNYLIQFDVPA